MTDKTLGAYQRHEKHDAADFARAKFARHPDGRNAHRGPDGTWMTNAPRESWSTWWGTDQDMANEGWSPVRECPNPEQHDRETTHPGGLSASEWKILAVSYGREMDSAREYAEETGEFAALWKETAREHIGRARTALSYADAAQLARSVAAVTPCSCSAQRARAEKAEKERDELRSLYEGQIEVIGRLQRAAESRPLPPDAISDEMRKRAREAFFTEWDRDDSTLSSVINAALTAALTEPPKRPEGAEEIEAVLREEWTFSEEDGGEEAFEDLAERLAQRGVRVVGEEQS